MLKKEVFDNHFKNIEKILDWWEFDGSSIEGKNLMEYLEVSMNDIKNEIKQCQKFLTINYPD